MTLLANPKSSYVLASREDRCGPRAEVEIPAMFRTSCGVKVHAVVRDISIAGLSCDVVSGAHPGAICWLTLPGLASQEAEIVWNNGQTVGCAFRNLLSQAVLDRLVTLHR